MNLEVSKLLASSKDTKISMVEVEKTLYVRIRRMSETAYILADDFGDYALTIEEAIFSYNKVMK